MGGSGSNCYFRALSSVVLNPAPHLPQWDTNFRLEHPTSKRAGEGEGGINEKWVC
jgi:hypothetical protein